MLIAVTGASGYLGGKVVRHLRAGGTQVLALSRRPNTEDRAARRYALGEEVSDDVLQGVSAVVHCAYDLRDRSPHGINVTGSLQLFDAVRRQGARVVLISSLSAYRGCQSLYGQSKLRLEQLVMQEGGAVVRPGLVFGSPPGGIFKGLVESISHHRVLPMIGGGHQRLYVSFDETLCALIGAMATGTSTVGLDRPVLGACTTSTSLHDLARELQRSTSHKIIELILPWRLVHGALRATETLGVRSQFHSDSVVALAHPIPLDQLAELDDPGMAFPSFSNELLH